MGNLKDFATSLVATAPSPATSGTSLVVTAGEGALFPAVPFFATAHPANEMPTLANAEKVQVTTVSTDTLTIVRARGATTAKSIAIGWRISNAVFAADIGDGWAIVTSNANLVVNAGVLANKATLLVLTLPAVAAVGDVISIGGMNAGLWKIAQNANGIIHFGNLDTATGVGGYISSTLARDAVNLVCTVANNEWNVVSSVGNITVA